MSYELNRTRSCSFFYKQICIQKLAYHVAPLMDVFTRIQKPQFCAPQKTIIVSLSSKDLHPLNRLAPKMRTSCQIAISIYVALVAAAPFKCPPTTTVTVTLWVEDHVPSSSAVPVTSAPHTCTTAAPDDSGKYMTIAITNSCKAPS